MNRRAVRKLEAMARRYDDPGPLPDLDEVEAALWSAGEVADRRLGGYWPWHAAPFSATGIENWTSQHLGWSFPCAEAVGLLRRVFPWEGDGRIVDVGAGRGLWTSVLARAFGSDRVVGLDPCPKADAVLRTSFSRWRDETGGPAHDDVLFASWLPCNGQSGSDLGPQMLDSIVADRQTFVYAGSGPGGPVGTSDFYDRLGVEFVEYASEPLPRVYPGVFPRDFIRVYHRKP